jgi:hypothetical protein
MARVGIELSPVACRIVELEAGSRRGLRSAGTRVRSFAILPILSRGAFDALIGLRGRRANVIVWNAQTDHRQVVVGEGSYERMRAEARAALRDVGVEARSTLADIAPASPPVRGTGRRTVLLATAAAPDVSAALGPLLDAGVKIGAVLTPAAALLSLARMRQALQAQGTPGTFEAYVAIEETVGCAVLVRDSLLLAARNLSWGYVEESGGQRLLRPREEIVARLADDLAEFVLACRLEGGALSQISICGPLPDLRSMTTLLVERLDVEVEPLDSLFGIDPAGLPAESDQFRERTSELRLAWAAAADAWPSIDLFRAGRRRRVKTYLSRAAIAAGVATGLGVGWMVQSRWWSDTSSAAVGRTQDRPAAARQARVSLPAPELLRPGTTSAAPQEVARRPVEQPALERAAAPERAASGAGGRSPVAAAPPVSGPPPRPAPSPAPSALPPRPTPAPAPSAPPRPMGASARGSTASTGQVGPVTVPLASPPQATPPPRIQPPAREAEVALPFDAVLGTILYGPDRKLAIVDGRIIEEGDEVKGARVVEITPTTVLLRDGQGRLRRLSAGASGR